MLSCRARDGAGTMKDTGAESPHCAHVHGKSLWRQPTGQRAQDGRETAAAVSARFRSSAKVRSASTRGRSAMEREVPREKARSQRELVGQGEGRRGSMMRKGWRERACRVRERLGT